MLQIPPENEHECDGGTALAHPSCVAAAQHLSHKAWSGKAMAAGMCQLCGDRFMKSPMGNEEVYSHTSSGVSQSKPKKGGSLSPNQSHTRNSRRAAKQDQSARGAKRLRSALTNGGVAAKPEIVDKRPAKSVKEEESEVQATQSGEKMDLASPEVNKVRLVCMPAALGFPAEYSIVIFSSFIGRPHRVCRRCCKPCKWGQDRV